MITPQISVASAQSLLALFILVKTVAGHGPEHPLTLQMAQTLAEHISQSAPPWRLQFIRSGVFRDMNLMELNGEGYRRARTLAMAMNNLGVHELKIEQAVDAHTWLRLAVELARGMMSPSPNLEQLELPGLSWRKIEHAGSVHEADDIDPEIFAITHVALAMRAMERWPQPQPARWPWRLGLTILRHLERAVDANTQAATRAMELAPGGWTPQRRAASMALHTLAVLGALEQPESARRASAHTALALGFCGLTARSGAGFEQASDLAQRKMLEGLEDFEPERLPQHYIQTCAFTTQLQGPPTDWLPSTHLLRLLYDLERERCPEGTTLSLTLADLLAIAARDMGSVYAPAWVRALIQAHGAWPPGAHVRLADGRTGLVLTVFDDTLELLCQGSIIRHPKDRTVGLISTWEATESALT